MAYSHGELLAEWMGNAHEAPPDYVWSESEMDLFNNRFGRMVGIWARDQGLPESDLSNLIYVAYQMNWLMTAPPY